MNKKIAAFIIFWIPALFAMEIPDNDQSALLDQSALIEGHDAHSPMEQDSPLNNQAANNNNNNNNLNSSSGWIFENKSNREVFCRWYYAPWDNNKKAYINPGLDLSQPIVSLKPEQKGVIPFSQPLKNHQRQLIFSFERRLVSDYIRSEEDNALPKGLLGVNKNNLSSLGSTWQIFTDESGPMLCPFFGTIKIINTTNKELYCALFHVGAHDAEKAQNSPIIRIKPQQADKIHFPKAQNGRDTQLFVHANKAILEKARLSPDEIDTVLTKSFKETNLSNWYFSGGEFEVLYDVTQKHKMKVASKGGGALQAVVRRFVDIETPNWLLEELERKFEKNKLFFEPVTGVNNEDLIIMQQSELQEEIKYCTKRKPVITAAINKLLEEEILTEDDEAPKIALVFCGGGYRAMTETIGFLRGADHDATGNILNCCMYMTALSGSTWAVNPLVLSGDRPQQFSDKQKFKIRSSRKTLYDTLQDRTDYHHRRFIESRYGQSHGPIGYYGHALANSLLAGFEKSAGKNVHDITLSDLQANLDADPSRYPFPISVAIDPGASDRERTWYEFSPYYVGTHQEREGSWVDTKLFGSIFKDKVLAQQLPEYPLAHYMGIWGSAFALSDEDIAKVSTSLGVAAKALSTSHSLMKSAYNLLTWKQPQEEQQGSNRVAAGEIPNYNFCNSKMPDGIQKKVVINLIDGGITQSGVVRKEDAARHNFASIPALWRKSDILIMCDSPADPETDSGSEHLVASDKEAQRFKLPFPTLYENQEGRERLKRINEDIETQGFSLIIEKDAPIIIYMKGQRNRKYNKQLQQESTSLAARENGFDPSTAGFTSTYNFKYSDTQFELLAGLTERIFIESKVALKEAIREAIKRKK